MAFVIAVAGVGTRLRASHARGRRFETRRAHAENAKPGLAAGAEAQSGNTAVGSKRIAKHAINYVGGVAMASSDRGSTGGITLGGIIVIIGIVLMIVWSFWIGLIVALIGLVAFGGFARGKWY
jgi:hypothetical protein